MVPQRYRLLSEALSQLSTAVRDNSTTSDSGRVPVPAELNLEAMRQVYAEIRLRLDTQDKNLNLAAVVFVGTSGFIVNTAVTGGIDSLISTQLSLLLPILALVMFVMLNRHLDLELNIAGAFEYLNQKLLPRLEASPGAADWEQFRIATLNKRWSINSWAIVLFSNSFATLLLAVIPLGFSIAIAFTRDDAAGPAVWPFRILTAIAAFLTVLEVTQFRSVLEAYRRIENQPRQP